MLGLSRKQHIMYIKWGQVQVKLVSPHQNFNLSEFYINFYRGQNTVHETLRD